MSYNLAKDLETVGILSLAPGATHLLHMTDDSQRNMQNILLLRTHIVINVHEVKEWPHKRFGTFHALAISTVR